MTDIIDQLREEADHMPSGPRRVRAYALFGKVSAEIKQLREALATCRELREIDKALIAKLRAPLKDQGGSEP